MSDVLGAIAKIRERITSSFDVFQSDEMIGEAARGVSQSLRDRHPEVPWPQLIALRNIVVHQYFGLNMHQVWTMIRDDLPKLEEQVQHIRFRIASDSGCGG